MENLTLEDFILVKKNAISPADCRKVTNYFDEMQKLNLTFDRHQLRDSPGHEKKDETCFPMEPDTLALPKTHPVLHTIVTSVKEAMSDYIVEYSILQDTSSHGIRSCRIQKTAKGGGYHRWHFESEGLPSRNRFLVFSIYLNNVMQGGETEFLYQSKRIEPEEGTLLIWPAGFTHVHRGNPPLSGNKYIATGWIEYFE